MSNVGLRLALEEHRHNGGAPNVRGVHERREEGGQLAVLAAPVDVGRVVEEQLDDGHVPFVGGRTEQRALVVTGVDPRERRRGRLRSNRRQMRTELSVGASSRVAWCVMRTGGSRRAPAVRSMRHMFV
jgi:hypothetical protein